jgi:hypothetical protein
MSARFVLETHTHLHESTHTAHICWAAVLITLLVCALRERLRTRDYMDLIGNNFTSTPACANRVLIQARFLLPCWMRWQFSSPFSFHTDRVLFRKVFLILNFTSDPAADLSFHVFFFTKVKHCWDFLKNSHLLEEKKSNWYISSQSLMLGAGQIHASFVQAGISAGCDLPKHTYTHYRGGALTVCHEPLCSFFYARARFNGLRGLMSGCV